MYLNEHFLRGVLPEALILSKTFSGDACFSVDSRTLQQGDIFVAIAGEKSDGHSYVRQALAAGASGLIIDVNKQHVLKQLDAELCKNKLIVAVANPLEALYALAGAWRTLFTGPVVAITGSIGKTSTKDMLAAMMRHNGKECLASMANQNTKLGVALNILRIRNHHAGAILEAGINARGEMAEIAQLLRPNYAVITGIGHNHLEGLGSIGDIAAEKRAIFKHFSEENIGIINGDQALLSSVGYHHPIVRFGFKTTNQIQARKVQAGSDQLDFILKIYNKKHAVSVNNGHTGMLFNTLAAASAAHLLGVPDDIIVHVAQKPVVVPGRFERRALKGNKGYIIHDAFNASPESMKTALLTFSRLQTSARKIVVLGDMLELGVNSPFWHRQLGRVLRKISSSHHIILVGSLVAWTKKTLPVGAYVDSVATWQEALPLIEKKLTEEESVVLIKGSHATGLHQLAETLSAPNTHSL